MKFNIVTHLTPHVSKKEAGCTCCGKYDIEPFLPFILEQIRSEVSQDRGMDTPMNFHSMSRCLHYNRLLGNWRHQGRVIEHKDVSRISNMNPSSVVSIIARADEQSFQNLKTAYGIIWKPLSRDTSRHVFIPDKKKTMAADFDMLPVTPTQLAKYIYKVMRKYDCTYCVLQYPKWKPPGVHFDVDTTRNRIVDQVRD